MRPLDACPICGDTNRVRLPDPSAIQSMLSDGRIWKGPLDKAACATCDSISHARTLLSNEVKRFYDTDYDLGVESGMADQARNLGYATFVLEVLQKVNASRVLEVGCGSGDVLAYLSQRYPGARFDGIEAAEQLSDSKTTGVNIRNAFLEDLPPPVKPYDMIFAINVIEHAAQPVRFLSALRRQMTPKGKALVICPSPTPPNLELLFRDHVTSFSKAGFKAVANAAGFEMESVEQAPPQFVGFQVFLLTNCDGREIPSTALASNSNRLREAASYLERWGNLDALLCERTENSTSIDLFGAGEVAALLRCYAPNIWSRVEQLVVDSIPGARRLEKSVVALEQLKVRQRPIVVATHPRSQDRIAERLTELGHEPIVFNDIIQN